MDNKDKQTPASKEMVKVRHKMVHDITQRLESFSLNTVISGFMEYNNKLIDLAKKEGGVDKETLETAVILLAPFAPHLCEELWEELGHEQTVFSNTWPDADHEAMRGRRGRSAGTDQRKDESGHLHSGGLSKEEAIARGKEAVADKITGTVVKEIYVPKKIINLVVK